MDRFTLALWAIVFLYGAVQTLRDFRRKSWVMAAVGALLCASILALTVIGLTIGY